ncbi:hypothetical protein [Pseudomonas sp. Marseille-P9899]|uniref:hypothetical protein n=1 Tax=Pseudomonas sp. Marseille-P9899 TaxID=2730401 RepID=UPI00158D832A|nr:hypothetical protein [Pseudomonas sp. Marseille-P9899]
MNRIVSLGQSMKLIKEHDPIALDHDNPLSGNRDERNVITNGRFENAESEFGPLVPWGILYDKPEGEIELAKYENGFAALIPRDLRLFQNVSPESFKDSLKFRISFKAKASIEFSTEEARHTECGLTFTFQTDTATGGNRMAGLRYCGHGWTEFSFDFERREDTAPLINAWFFIGSFDNYPPHPTNPKGVWFTDIKVIPLD